MWQTNLINNLIVILILFSIFVIIYCRVKGVTLLDVFKDIKEIISPSEVVE